MTRDEPASSDWQVGDGVTLPATRERGEVTHVSHNGVRVRWSDGVTEFLAEADLRAVKRIPRSP